MRPVLLTLALVALSTGVALPLGVMWGWALGRLTMRTANMRTATMRTTAKRGLGFRGGLARFRELAISLVGAFVLAGLFVMLATPLYIHAAGWEATAGKFGWLPLVQGGPRFWFRGLLAASWIHGTYGACWVALAVWIAFRQFPRAVAEAGSLDAGVFRSDWSIRLPLMRGWIVAAVAWSAVVAATEMTVADLYAVRTVADDVYKVYALQPAAVPVLWSTVLPCCLAFPLVWLAGSWLRGRNLWLRGSAGAADWYGRGRGEEGAYAVASGAQAREPFGSEGSGRIQIAQYGRWGWRLVVTMLMAVLGLVLIAGVPLTALVIKAGWTTELVEGSPRARFAWSVVGETMWRAPGSFARELNWTGQLIVCGIVGVVPAAWLAARLAERHGWLRWVGALCCLVLVAIPGPIVSMAVIWLFNRPATAWLYDRTLFPTWLALLPRALPVAYLVWRASYRMLDPAVSELALLDGAGGWRAAWRVELPRLWRGGVLAALAVGLVVLGDLSATILVLPPGVTTVASRLFGLLHSGVRNMEASLALLVAFFAAMVAIGVRRVVR